MAHALLLVARFTRRAVQNCTWLHWINVPRTYTYFNLISWRIFFPKAQAINVYAPYHITIVPSSTLVGCTRVSLSGFVRVLNPSHNKLLINLSTVEELILDVYDMKPLMRQLRLHEQNGDRAARRLRSLRINNSHDWQSMYMILKWAGCLSLTHLHMRFDVCEDMFTIFSQCFVRPSSPALTRPIPPFASLVSLRIEVDEEISAAYLMHLQALPSLRSLALDAVSYNYGGFAPYPPLLTTLPRLTDVTLCSFELSHTLLADLQTEPRQLSLRLVGCKVDAPALAALTALNSHGSITFSHD